MKYFLMIIALWCSVAVLAQEPAEDVLYETQKGKKYIVHNAVAGNTLYGLQQLYGVKSELILAANPGAEKGIKEGVKYLIPTKLTSSATNGSQEVEHVVVKGETLYALAKKYGCTVDEINRLNPTLNGALSLGVKIWIPVKTKGAADQPVESNTTNKTNTQTAVTYTDSIVTYTVQQGETMYTIAKRYMITAQDLQKFNNLKSSNIKPGDVIKIPVKKETIKEVPVRQVVQVDTKPIDQELLFNKKNEYVIGVLLPFGLDNPTSAGLKNISTEFYMGVELAKDSLEALGLKATVKIIDFPVDSVAAAAYLKKPEMKKLDLIIGPILPKLVDQVAPWCKENKIRMVCPSNVNSSVLKGNPYVYAAVASEMTQMKVMAKYTIEQFKNTQFVLVDLKKGKDADLYDAFRTKFNELSGKNGNAKLIETNIDNVANHIRKNGNTVLIVPSRDEKLVSTFFNNLNKQKTKAGEGQMTVIGTKDWANFESLTAFYRNEFQVHWSNSSDLNYSLEPTKALLKAFRIAYKTDMTKAHVQGYDVLTYFAPYLLLDKNSTSIVQNNFDMKQVLPGCGYENSSVFIMKHQDYQLIRVGAYVE